MACSSTITPPFQRRSVSPRWSTVQGIENIHEKHQKSQKRTKAVFYCPEGTLTLTQIAALCVNDAMQKEYNVQYKDLFTSVSIIYVLLVDDSHYTEMSSLIL